MGKLTDQERLEGKLVRAHLEPSFRHTEVDGRDSFDQTRFRFVVDEYGEPLAGGLSEQYTLVQNREFISALDLAADERGLDLQPRKAVYRNGRGLYEFGIPSHKFRITNDRSDTEGLIRMSNDYRGQGGLGIMSGWFRLICSNGLIVGTIAHRDMRRHVGDIDVYKFVCVGLDRFVERFETERILAETLGNERYTPSADSTHATTQVEAREAIERTGGDLLARILADTPDRYNAPLQRAVRENQRDAGDTLWGIVQAVAEVATHRMQETARGGARSNYSFAADTWSSRQVNRVRELVTVRR